MQELCIPKCNGPGALAKEGKWVNFSTAHQRYNSINRPLNTLCGENEFPYLEGYLTPLLSPSGAGVIGIGMLNFVTFLPHPAVYFVANF